MDGYASFLERTRVPQPSLQKFAVVSIFTKFRSHPESEPGRDAITYCLHSSSPAVVDQSVRELCRLVSDSKFDLAGALVELQSALEGSEAELVDLFVKALGFLVRVGFERKHQFGSLEKHPFIKILSCRAEVHGELVQQVLLLLGGNRGFRMVEVCDFLRPFLNFVILRMPFSDSLSYMFARELMASMASFCCSVPDEAMPVLRLLTGCLRHLPQKRSGVIRKFYSLAECVVDAYTVVLKHLVGTRLLVAEAQLLGVELSESLLALFQGQVGGSEPVVELVKRLCAVQKDLALQYVPELSSVLLSLFVMLVQSEVEHEQLSILKLLTLLLRWKSEIEYGVNRMKYALSEELLFIYPVVNFMSSVSQSVKGAAADLLLTFEKILIQVSRAPKVEPVSEGRSQPICPIGSIVYRLLKDQWLQDQCSLSTPLFLNLTSVNKTYVKEMDEKSRPWAFQLKERCLNIVDRRKSSLPISESQEIFLREMPQFLGAITCALVMHQLLGNIAMDLLAAIGVMDPKQGVTLLLAILFYSNIFSRKDIIKQHMLPKVLAMVPSLASHSVMIPLVIQTILPMLQKNGKSGLYSTGIRLLCKTWEINDRAFGSLQALLLPKVFTEFKSDRNVCISSAASIRDVCRKNPDRGVDLILSVSACIESQDPIIQALGLQGLAHLCEADAIDFYTAWDVIAKHVLDYSKYPVIAQSVCLLLRWGSMDAEAYPQASKRVLQILWNLATSRHGTHVVEWAKARISAFGALNQYEVSDIGKAIPDFEKENTDVLLSETNFDVLRAMEAFQVKIITHEHTTRRRLVKERRVIGSKIEKLLDVLPKALFPSGKESNYRCSPGAALLCISLATKDVHNQALSRMPLDAHSGYENMLVEIAASLELSKNILVALLALQSWKSFIRHWMKANIFALDAKASSTAVDKTSKAANDILKSMMQIAEDSIPKSAENIGLAVGALCMVLPSSAHTIKSTASKFLLKWLFQHEHEHRQWSAAISLGLISSCLHVTDHRQKFQNVTGLIEVFCGSKSKLVKGACGVGLGFSCQDLLSRVEATDNVGVEKENYWLQEVNLLGKIVRALLLMISEISEASHDILESLSAQFPSITKDFIADTTSQLLDKGDDLEEDIWGVAGIILGLGSCLGALYRAGAHDLVIKIKDLIISWIPYVGYSLANTNFSSNRVDKVLSVGSCLALPNIMAFCRRVEMVNDNELDHVLNGCNKLISDLVSVKRSGTFHQSLLAASCIGAGSLLAFILKEGVHPVEIEFVNKLLELFRKCYSHPYHPIIHFGGMLGVVNAMGAAAGILVQGHHFSASVKTGYEKMESPYLLGPLLSSPICEPQLLTYVQEIFLVAKDSDDLQMQRNAAWAISLLQNALGSKALPCVGNNVAIDSADSKAHSIAENSLVMKLSLWLMHFNFSEANIVSDVGTVATVLRCLSRAPRLPSMEWGSIIRRSMRYGAQNSELLPPDGALTGGTLREESIQFSLAHANQFEPLLTFLDELSDLPRFMTLEWNLQTCLLLHLDGLTKIFSGSRLEKLFNDIAEFFSLVFSNKMYASDGKNSLRISCWKGIYQCLDEASLNSGEYITNIGKCIKVLFSLLPASEYAATLGTELLISSQEWDEAVKCLSKAPEDWLLDFLQVPLGDVVEGDDQSNGVLKKIIAKAKLVKIGSLPFTELRRLKAYILDFKSHGIWNVLVEVVAALQYAEGSVKRQWLVDTVEISCVSSCPSTAILFLGLLAGSCCKYMPLLTLERSTVLSDIPVTLTSLLTQPSWEVVSESVASSLWQSTERIYNWINGASFLNNSSGLIDESEKDMADLLLRVMHRTCLALKGYLPLEKQLTLANMVINRGF